MPEVELFRVADQQFKLDAHKLCVNPLVNETNSTSLGGGTGVFGAGIEMEWTVNYDEILFIREGDFELQVDGMKYLAGPGDVLWIPSGVKLVYKAEHEVTFFYAISPVENAPSMGKVKNFVTTAPVAIDD